MATRKRKSTPSMGTLLLVTATEAEAIFFSQMRKDCRYANLTVMHSGAKTLAEHISFTSKAKFKNRFDAAFALFGFDDVNTNVEEVKKAEEDCKSKKIGLCYFNPSFHLWVYLHLAKPNSFIISSDAMANAIASKIEGYEISSEYLMTKGLNLHMQLFPRHAQADINARDYNVIAMRATGLKATTMPELNQKITEICGQADMSHNTKIFK
ncbi:RloB domain-containing protein [Bullifex porci]|uniref:RloB domain-containing protein n=1 Tax=Bullifex porci TaxID=2606638 RepID=UPI0023EFA775|nr:RloB domain-containing protein [Bullifex porci]MDD7255455.1 RloB domain-containing protein [Bullifex porci]MDY2741350.1 RloB domain-containing protein [Bullifex porci]